MADRLTSEQLLQKLQSLEVQAGERWRHFKGGQYTVVALAVQEADLEPVVVYRPEGSAVLFTRPYQDWIAAVEVAGQSVPRFERLSGSGRSMP